MPSQPWIFITHAGLGYEPERELYGPFLHLSWDPHDPQSVSDAIATALRFDKQVARDFLPTYSPHFYVDEEIWHHIKRRFHYVPRDRISVIPPATDAQLLASVSWTTAEMVEIAGRSWVGIKNSVRDAYGRPVLELPAAALRVVDAHESYMNRWANAMQRAARPWLKDRWPVLVDILTGIPPARRKLHDMYSLRAAVTKGWIAAGRPATRDFKSVRTLMQYCERIGVFRPKRNKRYMWGPVWKYGLTPESNSRIFVTHEKAQAAHGEGID